MGKINSRYYSKKNLCHHLFGFRTLDLSGELEEFKGKMKDFTKQIKNIARLP